MATPAALRMVTPATQGVSSLALPLRRAGIDTRQISPASHFPQGLVARNSRITRLARQSRVLSKSRLLLESSYPSCSSCGFLSSTITENRLRATQVGILNVSTRGGALGAVCQLPTTPEHLRWVMVAASAVLMYVRSSGVQAQLLVPLLAVEAPRKALGWLQGDYGLWVAFLALATKLFGVLPVALELPLYLILLVITAPAQITQYRGTQAAAGVSLAIAAYLGYQHYKKSDGAKGALKGEAIFPSIAILLLTVIPILFLVNGTSA